MDTARAAIVGCGCISDLHQLGHRDRADAGFEAVCDRGRGRAEAQAAAWGVTKVYTGFEQVLSDRDIDLVELLTPHHLHCPMTIAATGDMPDQLRRGGRPRLDGPTGKAVLQVCLAALESARSGREVRPADVR